MVMVNLKKKEAEFLSLILRKVGGHVNASKGRQTCDQIAKKLANAHIKPPKGYVHVGKYTPLGVCCAAKIQGNIYFHDYTEVYGVVNKLPNPCHLCRKETENSE